MDVNSFTLPGAGLTAIDSEDQIFESIFSSRSCAPLLQNPVQPIDAGTLNSEYTPLLRSYESDESILNAYYIFIHPYFPILPPPQSPLKPDMPLENDLEQFEPSSPISLALSAVLTLIPHPNDLYPGGQEMLSLRRNRAHLFATLAMESIEIEAEVLDSSISPADALSSDPSPFARAPFCPAVPVEIESVLAYLVLSIYEYAQRGNLAKMRNRASQAYDAAIRLSLHEDHEPGLSLLQSEARRRAWWMTVRPLGRGRAAPCPDLHSTYASYKARS